MMKKRRPRVDRGAAERRLANCWGGTSTPGIPPIAYRYQSAALLGPMPHVLVIEDDAQLRPVIARMLRVSGYEATEAADGASGLARWRDGGADVVLTDLYLGDMDGIQVVLQLRAQASA